MESLNEVVFVLGGPGSGKGTVCSKIQKEFDYVHLSAGDLLRVEKEGSGETSEMINKILLDGGIVPAEITVGLLGKAMQSSGSKKFLIDGFPRNHDNLLVWYDLMSETSTVSFVLNMDLSEEDMLKRLLERSKSSGRSDDNEETIKKRFKTFYQDTMPVLDMYSMAGKLRTISSAPPPAVVYHETSKLFRSLKILAPFQRTFALIKPDAVANNSVPDILNAIAEASLSVVVMKVITMSSQAMSQFYKEHEGKNFFPELKEFMTSGPAIALVLEGTDAVKRWREIMGPTNTLTARNQAPESIRARFGTDKTKNACHGSDSEKSAMREIRFWMDPDSNSTGALCVSGDITTQGIINVTAPKSYIPKEFCSGDKKSQLPLQLSTLEDTFAMIKPITSQSCADEILAVIAGHGFQIVSHLHTTLSMNLVEKFYSEHKGKSFFESLTQYMASGPVIALHLRRTAAVSGWRHLIGPTNIEKARSTRPDSLRSIFGIDGTRNACHGSDAVASAQKEIAFFFSIGGSPDSRPLSSRNPLGPIKQVQVQSPKKKNNPEVAVMSRKDIALMEEYANYELDPIMKNLLQKLMICRPSNVPEFVIKELNDLKMDDILKK